MEVVDKTAHAVQSNLYKVTSCSMAKTQRCGKASLRMRQERSFCWQLLLLVQWTAAGDVDEITVPSSSALDGEMAR